MLLKKLEKQKLIHPPNWLSSNTAYLTIMGSEAYGVSSGDSDKDIYGMCVPPKDMVFPESFGGQITGFGNQIKPFNVWQQHHVEWKDKRVMYDFAIYGIVSYFQLIFENNPNCIDSLFTPRRCVIHSTQLAEHMRENRRLFLSKWAWPKFRGYSFSQMSKIREKTNYNNEKRAKDIEAFGYSTKYSYHLVRLLLEIEQILIEHDLDLERNSEILKTIRRGEWTLEELEDWFTNKEKSLEEIYGRSTLRAAPDEAAIKQLLIECLEQHYGSLDKALVIPNKYDNLLTEMQAVLDKYK